MNRDGERSGFGKTLNAARLGSTEALAELFDAADELFRRWSATHRLSGRLRARYDEADVFQAASLDALRALPLFHGQSQGEFLAWFRRLLENKSRELARRHTRTAMREVAREVPLIGNDERGWRAVIEQRADSVVEIAIRHERQEDLQRALALISPLQRTIIDLHFKAGLSFDAIAERFGATSEAMRSAYRRGCDRLVIALCHVRARRKPPPPARRAFNAVVIRPTKKPIGLPRR